MSYTLPETNVAAPVCCSAWFGLPCPPPALPLGRELGEPRHVVAQDAHIRADHDTKDVDQRTITDLRTRLDTMYDKVAEMEYIRSRNAELENLNAQLRRDNHKLRFDGLSSEECAKAYMEGQGKAEWHNGNKIACIKGVRECTGWGLKDSKDYCEAYPWNKVSASEEGSGPGTKRSSGQVAKAG